jgi:hypothetical protein
MQVEHPRTLFLPYFGFGEGGTSLPFTPQQDAVIRQALSQKVKGQCPMSFSRDWAIADDVVARVVDNSK